MQRIPYSTIDLANACIIEALSCLLAQEVSWLDITRTTTVDDGAARTIIGRGTLCSIIETGEDPKTTTSTGQCTVKYILPPVLVQVILYSRALLYSVLCSAEYRQYSIALYTVHCTPRARALLWCKGYII